LKIQPARAAQFLSAPPSGVRAVLFYGPDGGLVRERALALTALIAADPSDPFRVVEMTGRTLAEDGARLADEAAAISFTGGRRVVRLRDAGDGAARIFEAFLGDGPGDAMIVVESGDLPPRSSLRKLFEKSEQAAAIACYRDEGRDLEQVIRQSFSTAGLAVEPDALTYLLTHLGGDRQLSRRELEKVILYKGTQTSAVGLADVEACVGNSSALALDDVADAAALGDLRRLTTALARCLQEGASAIAVLRAVAVHFQRLHLVTSRVAAGERLDDALKRLKPPLFWKKKEAFTAQLRLWRPEDLGPALERLLAAERSAKTTGIPAEPLLGITLYRLALSPARRRAAATRSPAPPRAHG
jgi:DNA polymerase-3 subunit delta